MDASAHLVAGRKAEFAIRAETGDLRLASAWLARTGKEHSLPAGQITRLDQCLDEAVANVIAHAGLSAHDPPINLVFVTQAHTGYREASVSVIDSGAAFDPLSVQPAQRPTNLLDAEPGGLGLTMMRSFADALEYRHHAGRNHLTFHVRWADPACETPD